MLDLALSKAIWNNYPSCSEPNNCSACYWGQGKAVNISFHRSFFLVQVPHLKEWGLPKVTVKQTELLPVNARINWSSRAPYHLFFSLGGHPKKKKSEKLSIHWGHAPLQAEYLACLVAINSCSDKIPGPYHSMTSAPKYCILVIQRYWITEKQ